MADCLTDAEPVNPINQLILDTFGDNFFPTHNSSFQPPDATRMSNEKLLNLALPAKATLRPPPDANKNNMLQTIAQVMGPLGTVFAMFAPIFVILDFIRAIVDVICALLNPVPVVSAVVSLLIEFAPPIIALFPPLSSILLAINAIKVIMAVVATIIANVVPIIDLIVKNALEIPGEFSRGNFGAVDGISVKICTLFKLLDNQLGMLSPLSFIIDILNFFMSLGSKFFCFPGGAASESTCCDESNCPPIIVNPAGGTARVLSQIQEFTIRTLVSPLGIPLSEDILDTVLVQPEMGLLLSTRVSQANSYGLTSSVGVGYLYSQNDIAGYSDYIVDIADKDTAKATLNIRLESSSQVVTAPITKIENGVVYVKSDNFQPGSEVKYTIQPNFETLLTNSKIGIGCMPDVAVASKGLRDYIDSDNDSSSIYGGDGSDSDGTGTAQGFSGTDAVVEKIGKQFPLPPIEALAECVAAQQANPTVSQAACIVNTLTDYINELTDLYERLSCVGASSTNSIFSASKTYAFAGGDDFVELSLAIRDMGGNNLLLAPLPNAKVSVKFYTTHGKIGPVMFNDTTGTFTASLTASDAGNATVRAAFVVNGKTCMRPKKFNGFAITDNVIDVKFVPDAGEFRRRRKDRQYVQSRGGRRR